MAQTKKNKLDLKKKLKGESKSTPPWVFWAIGAVILIALIGVLALVVPSFMPGRQPSFGSVPTGAESIDATSGAGALAPVSKGDRLAMIDGAKQSGAQIADDSVVSAHYDKDQQHAVLSIPSGSGNTFRVKTIRLVRGGDGSWSIP